MNQQKLKHFIAASKSIKANGIIPALACIKAERTCPDEITLTKSSLDSWYIETIPATGATFTGVVLFDEKPLAAYLSISKDETVNMKVNGKKVSLFSGGNTIEFTMVDEKDYPKSPAIDTEDVLYTFTQDDADALHMALSFVKKDLPGFALENIFIIDGYIYASNGFYGFRYPTAAPDMVLSTNAAAAINEGSNFVLSGNYTCIISPEGTKKHLFITPEANAPSFKSVFADGSLVSSINTSELISGLKLTLQMASEKMIITDVGDGRMVYKEDAYGVLLDYAIETGNFSARLNASLMLPILSAIPQQEYDIFSISKGIFSLQSGNLYILFTTLQ